MVLTKNPIREGSSNDNAASSDLAMFVCPLSMKEMNGSQPFVYLATCGCVFSLAGLTTLLSGKSRKSKSKSSDAESKPPSSSDDKNKESESSDDDKDKEHCPQCNKPFYPHLTSGSAKSLAPLSAPTEAPSATALPIPPADADIVMLNSSEEEAFTMRVGMEKKRLEAKKSRKEKKGKRKGGSEEEGGGNANGNKDAGDVVAAANGEPPSKRTKISPARSTSPPGIKPSRPSSHAPTPRSHTNYNKNPAAANINPALPSTARLIAQDLAAGDVNRKSKMTDAVRSLYHTEESKNKKETFMTRGTYTRVSSWLRILPLTYALLPRVVRDSVFMSSKLSNLSSFLPMQF